MEANGNADGLSRRGFFKTAVAIGGASALSACLGRETVDVPTGGGEVPERQHAWNDFLRTDDHGNFLPPRHHVLLLLDYTGEAVENDRPTVEDAFASLEGAYEWSNEGLLFTVGYSPYYFDRFDETLDVAIPEPEPMASFENPDLDDVDAVVHLASDYASVVLEAEEALLGERADANGFELNADLTESSRGSSAARALSAKASPLSTKTSTGYLTTNPFPRTRRCTWGSTPASRGTRQPRTT
jgi:hypothetical protein